MMFQIKKTGVVYFRNGYEPALMVNQEDLLSILEELLDQADIPKDYDGRFAGTVKIEITNITGEENEKREET